VYTVNSFSAERTNGRAYATVLRLSVVCCLLSGSGSGWIWKVVAMQSPQGYHSDEVCTPTDMCQSSAGFQKQISC